MKFKTIWWNNSCFCWDFRQIFPVAKRGTKAAILQATLKYSHLWSSIKLACRSEPDAQEFLDYTNKIGDGSANESGENPVVEIPPKMISKAGNLERFISEIYDQIDSKQPLNSGYFTDHVILTSLNVDVDDVNDLTLSKFNGQEFPPLYSADSISDEDNKDLHPTEFLIL